MKKVHLLIIFVKIDEEKAFTEIVYDEWTHRQLIAVYIVLIYVTSHYNSIMYLK